MINLIMCFAVGLVCGIAGTTLLFSAIFNDSNSKKTGLDSKS
jgi:hypothetical protein